MARKITIKQWIAIVKETYPSVFVPLGQKEKSKAKGK